MKNTNRLTGNPFVDSLVLSQKKSQGIPLTQWEKDRDKSLQKSTINGMKS